MPEFPPSTSRSEQFSYMLTDRQLMLGDHAQGDIQGTLEPPSLSLLHWPTDATFSYSGAHVQTHRNKQTSEQAIESLDFPPFDAGDSLPFIPSPGVDPLMHYQEYHYAGSSTHFHTDDFTGSSFTQSTRSRDDHYLPTPIASDIVYDTDLHCTSDFNASTVTTLERSEIIFGSNTQRATPCRWGTGCGAILHNLTPTAISNHLKEHHFEFWDDRARGQCQWEGTSCRNGMDMYFGSFGKHVACVHLRSTTEKCRYCGETFSRPDVLVRHEKRYCPGQRQVG